MPVLRARVLEYAEGAAKRNGHACGQRASGLKLFVWDTLGSSVSRGLDIERIRFPDPLRSGSLVGHA